MKKLLIVLSILFFIPNTVFADDITGSSKITVNNNYYSKLTDKNENSYVEVSEENEIKIQNDEDIYGIYIIYEMNSVEGIISNEKKEASIATHGFLHEYIDVDNLIGHSNEIILTFNETVKIGELYILNKGDLPDYIEVWEDPCDKADLVLFSTHSDDEQLFFAGLMPYYVAKGAMVQVVYFTNHNDNPKRLHEQIHGLYTVGIRNYPVIGFVPDAWATNLDGALSNMNRAGFTEEDAIKFEVEMIRRFKPLVVVGHDEKGEYSHGQHILNTYILKKAILLTNDNSYDTESFNKFGAWDTPKTYIHLYSENQIIMNYDEPLEYFNGKTAYEVSKEGYSKHLSQQYTWFTKWLTGVNDKGVGTPFSKASEIKTYSPCQFGLYRTLVGEDINKNDMFENLTLRKDEIVENDDDTSSNEPQIIQNKVKKITNKIPKEYYLYGFGILIILMVIRLLTRKKR